MTNSIWGPLRSAQWPSNKPIRIVWNAGLLDGGHMAVGGADLRRRKIHLHPRLKTDTGECFRILAHEFFHFVWLRLGNPRRDAWKALLRTELDAGARGELGWPSEWRKRALPARFAEYACEAFCDTGAWVAAGCVDHPECALAGRWRARRSAWFRSTVPPPYRA